MTLPPDQPPGTEPDDSRRQLMREIEIAEARARHWHEIAERNRIANAALRRNPVVRVALWADTRIERMRPRVGSVRRGFRASVGRARLAAAARRVSPQRVEPLASTQPPEQPVPPLDRSATVIVIEGDTGPSSPMHPPSTTAVDTIGPLSVAEALRAANACLSDVIVLLRDSARPVGPAWLDRLVGPLHDGSAGAALPIVVHPRRAWHDATPHDGLVRSAGLEVFLTPEGAPAVRSRAAGSDPQVVSGPTPVDAAEATCIAFLRERLVAVGGFDESIVDPDAAVIDVTLRLAEHSWPAIVVPGVAVTDHRDVRSVGALTQPIAPTSAPWREIVGRHGPALRRRAGDSAPSLTITVACPDEKVAARWGDWHLAQGLAASLERLGVRTRVQTFDRRADAAGHASDVHIVVRGLERVRRVPGQAHILWIISHPETVTAEECDDADLVLVASDLFTAHLRSTTTTPVEVFHQATDHRRFRPEAAARRTTDIVVVAKTRGARRPMVAAAIDAGLPLRIYGGGWRDLVDPAFVVTDHVDNDQVPAIYAAAAIVLNDHWDTMRRWGFVSNRIYDVLASGTPVVSDAIAGLDELIGAPIPTATSAEELRAVVDDLLGDPQRTSAQVARARDAVLVRHTFDRRARQLLDLLERHELPTQDWI